MSSQQFCLKWNNHTSNMLNVFEHLLSTEALVDVTLACDGLSLKAHKMVLSACSPFFQSLFLENPCKHPIVILKDMSYKDLKAIIDFMYRGEVNVSQDQLSALLKTAETLKVKGLVEVSGENRQASGVVQQEISTPQSTPAQTMQQNQSSSRPDSPLSGKRKRGRPRRRSLSGSNRSDDESVPSKIKDLGSPEIEELSGDASMDGAGDMLQSNSSQSQVHPTVNRVSSSRHHRSSRQMNAQVEELPSGDDNEFEVEPSKLLEQTLTTDNASNASSNMSSHFPSSSGIEISQIGLGDSQALVPSSAATDALSSSHLQGPDSPQDIKPSILTFDEPPVSPVAGPSHQSSDRSMMMYMDQSSMPGPSNYQDQALVQSDSQSQVAVNAKRNLSKTNSAEQTWIDEVCGHSVGKKGHLRDRMLIQKDTVMPPRRTSSIWYHFNEKKSNRAECKYCNAFISTAGGSLGNLRRHLKKKHPFVSAEKRSFTPSEKSSHSFTTSELPGSSQSTSLDASTSSLTDSASSALLSETYLESQLHTSQSSRELVQVAKPLSNSKSKAIDTQLLRMICKEYYPFSLVEDPEFKKFVSLLCPGYKLPSRKTLSENLSPQ